VSANPPPADLKYTKTHEWVRFETNAAGQQIATIGITAFALEALTDLVFVDLPKIGREVTAGTPFGEIESVKAVSDLNSPVSGKVTAVNADLVNNLPTLGEDPYGKGWFVKVAVSGSAAQSDLLDAAAYERQCAEQSHE
jgi:glycine cleavage system H protein